MTGPRMYTPEDLAPGHAAYREQLVARMRELLDGPCGRQVFAVLLALVVRDPEAELTKAAIVEHTDFAEPTVRRALDRAEAGALVTVTRRRQPDRHRYYRLTPAGVEFAEQLAARASS
jgi:DNA-binding MarR family transcriptional regulator